MNQEKPAWIKRIEERRVEIALMKAIDEVEKLDRQALVDIGAYVEGLILMIDYPDELPEDKTQEPTR